MLWNFEFRRIVWVEKAPMVLRTGLAVLIGFAGIVMAFMAAAAETVSFDVTPKFGPSITLTAEMTKPEGYGPFAAVVMLHGCSGPWKPWGNPWSARLVRWGYVALQVDSFGPRGFPEGICEREGAVGALTTAKDSHAAKAYLQRLSFVDPNRIGVMGMSPGGEAAIWAVQNTYIVDVPRPDPFKAAIAFYPYCVPALIRLDAPLLVLTGEMDDWTPSGICERMTIEGPTDHEMKLKVYPGATHAFDVAGMDHEYLGHTMKYDPVATQDAVARSRAFLRKYLGDR